MGKKKHEFEEGTMEEQEAPPGFEPRQLYMVVDPKSPKNGQNVRIVALLEPLEGGEAKIKFQYQVPRGPGREAQTFNGCPECGYGAAEGAKMNIPATTETAQKNEIKFLTEGELKKFLKDLGARLVDG
jgi:hypothetical protein